MPPRPTKRKLSKAAPPGRSGDGSVGRTHQSPRGTASPDGGGQTPNKKEEDKVRDQVVSGEAHYAEATFVHFGMYGDVTLLSRTPVVDIHHWYAYALLETCNRNERKHVRIGINVPDRIMRRIKELDPRVNISQICRDILSSYCGALERIESWVDDYDEEVEEQVIRLSQEPPIEPDWVGHGLEDAREWVRTMHPDQWRYFWHSRDTLKEQAKDLRFLVDFYSGEGVKGFHDRYREHASWFIPPQLPPGIDRRDAFDRARENYYLAWQGYVNRVRSKQLRNYEEIRKGVLAEREESLQTALEPEIPPQLVD